MMRGIIVEDEWFALKVNKKILQETGHIEIIYESMKPSEALPVILELQPDVLFVDVRMPGMSGFELVERASSYLPHMEIVFITSYDEYAVRAFEVNALDYLLKPLIKEHAERTVRRLLDRKVKRSNESKNMNDTTSGSVHLFGYFKVIAGNGAKEIKWKHAKAEELFIHMCIQPDQKASKEMIMDRLWPDMPREQALVNLNSTIYRLKKIFLEEGMSIEIRYNNGWYELNLFDITCDLFHLEQIWKHIQNLTKSAEVSEIMRDIVAHYQGPLLQYKEYQWASPFREFHNTQFILYCKVLLRILVEQNDTGSLEKWANVLLTYEPLDEELQEFLLQSYFMSNQRTAFVQHYLKWEKLLENELGIKPNDQLQAWYQQMKK